MMAKPGSVIIIDDNPLNTRLARDTLEEAGYEVMDSPNADEGIRLVKRFHPEIVLMDIMMPGLAGDEATRLLKSDPDTGKTKIILVSARATPEEIVSGFKCHADDYITKPYYPQILLERVKSQMIVHRAESITAREKNDLKSELLLKSQQLEKSYESIFLSLAKAAETRHARAAIHMERISRYIEILINELRKNGKYMESISDELAEAILWASQLHDIGKVGVPDSIINSRNRSRQERMIFRQHTVIGGEIFQNAARTFKGNPPVQLITCEEIARRHHERYDGMGYPDGLAGEAIPLSARLVALANSYDPTADWDLFPDERTEDTHRKIINGRGTLFDPVIVDAYTANRDAFEKVTSDTGLTINII
ncbi:MAG: two-component system response regulator [Nitrospinota bacterium]